MQLSYDQLPKISKTANVNELMAVFSNLNIPGVFEFNVQDGLLAVKSVKNELSELNITFPNSMLCKNTDFPKFVFCKPNVTTHNQEFLTHWELMYMLMASRLPSLANHNVVYGGLIQRDIASVNKYVIYTEANAYNAKIKNKNLVVMLDPYDHTNPYRDSFKYATPFGDWLFKTRPHDETIRSQIESMNCIPSSETMLSESQKVVLDSFEDEYKAPAFEMIRKNGRTLGFKTLFPPKQNVPSRLKTHLHGEAYNYIKPDQAIYLQDAIYQEDGSWVTKDSTLRNVIVLFEEIDPESYRFGAGEIEVSKEFGNEIVVMKKHRELQLSQIFLKEDETYYAHNGTIKIGKCAEDETKIRTIENVDHIKVLKVEETGFGNGYRIEFMSYNKASNARVVSQTGFKGVTKVMADLGKVKHGRRTLPIGAACSINSLKGKMNTIILAQAALAVKIGTYVPKNGELLDSLDEDEINAAAQSLPAFKHIKGGIETDDVKVGLIQVSVTELGSMYAKLKPQTFSFNALKYLDERTDKSFATYIRENHINELRKEITMELNKVIQDEYGFLIEEDSDMPIYRLDELKDVFTMTDLFLARRNIIHYESNLLNEEFNQGFYIHCKPQADEYIRIPSAKVLNAFWSRLETNGEYVYEDILINISKIIAACIEEPKKPKYHYVTYGAMESNKTRITARMAYVRGCKNMLYSGELGGQQIIKTLLSPELPGISLKQVPDKYVPAGVVVILDDKIYRKLHNVAYEKEQAYQDNDFLCFALRNPHLWRTQTLKQVVWDSIMFDQYLQEHFGFGLEDYIPKELNRFCVLVSKDLICKTHSDADGDLLSLSLPKGLTGQMLLEEFELEGVMDVERKWDEEYLKSEISSNEDIDYTKQYKIYTIYNSRNLGGNDSYNIFLTNAAIAKSAVGGATNDSWAMYMLLQIYRGLLINEPEEAKMPFADNRPINLTPDKMKLFDHIYIRLIEEKVINAIKHVSNGSLGFQKYQLNAFGDPKHDKKIVLKELQEEFGVQRKDAIEIISLIIWAHNSGYLKACKSFLSMHNKGVVETDEDVLSKFENIVKYTFVGSLFAEFFEISKRILKIGEEVESSGSVNEDNLSFLSMF